MIPAKYEWVMYVVFAGLAWGTYVPLIFYGGGELPTAKSGMGGRLTAILCVGGAYFVIAVLIPLLLFFSKQAEWPTFKTTGIVFSSLAGIAGALGAICVVFAARSAVGAARQSDLAPDTFRIYIAPLIFVLAPVINTLVSLIWHPEPDSPFHFHLKMPGWKLVVGIVLVSLGAGLVLWSKEEAEVKEKQAKGPSPAPAVAAAPLPEESNE